LDVKYLCGFSLAAYLQAACVKPVCPPAVFLLLFPEKGLATFEKPCLQAALRAAEVQKCRDQQMCVGRFSAVERCQESKNRGVILDTGPHRTNYMQGRQQQRRRGTATKWMRLIMSDVQSTTRPGFWQTKLLAVSTLASKQIPVQNETRRQFA